MSDTYIGIDAGTSGIKLLLINAQQKILAQCSLEYELSHPREGWSEIDPNVWYENALKGLRRLLEGQDPSRVSTIGVTGQMHTLVLLGADGECVRPAMMWNDKRTADCVPILQEALAGEPDGDYLRGIVSTGSPAANLYWVSRHEPDVLARCRHFLIGPDYLVYRLTGKIGTEYVEASTSSLYGIRNRAWSERLRALIGLPASAYPPVRGSAEVVGVMKPELARGLGLREDVKIIAGTGDNAATAVSTGCIGRGYPVLSLGTSGVLIFPVHSMDQVSRGKVMLFSTDGRDFLYLVQGVVQSTGESVNWWLRKVQGLQNFGTMDSEIDEALIRSSQVLYYPHINGDKTLYADPKLRGAFIGLSSQTGPAELYYAVIEGICFAFRELIERMGLDIHGYASLKVVGGGAKSDLWLQSLANVLNVNVERLGGAVGPGFGIAMLAYAADQGDMGMEALTYSGVTVEQTFVPDAGLIEVYQRKYARYLRIHDALKHIEGEPLPCTPGAPRRAE